MLVVTQDNHTMSSNGSAKIRWASKCRKIVLLTQGNRNPEIFKWTTISSGADRVS